VSRPTDPDTARRRRARLGGAEGNELLTSATGLVLAALLVAVGVTIVWMGDLLTAHMLIGLALIPPVALKLASTGYRFARYYTAARAYREKGPPMLALRLLAPVLVVATALVLVSGVLLLLLGHRSGVLLELHKVGFIVWGACFAVHFLWYLPRACRSLSAAWTASAERRVPGFRARGMLVSASVGGGLALALALLSLIQAWPGRG
jgi:hypothetical protein